MPKRAPSAVDWDIEHTSACYKSKPFFVIMISLIVDFTYPAPEQFNSSILQHNAVGQVEDWFRYPWSAAVIHSDSSNLSVV